MTAQAYEIELTLQPDDQVFSLYHDETMFHFNVTLLGRIRKQCPAAFTRITMNLSDKEYDLVTQHRGIEEPKVIALEPRQLREPGLGVILPNNDFSIVDGHHRLVRRYRGGLRVMDFYVTDENVWQHCLVPYSEEETEVIKQSVPPRNLNPERVASFVAIHRD